MGYNILKAAPGLLAELKQLQEFVPRLAKGRVFIHIQPDGRTQKYDPAEGICKNLRPMSNEELQLRRALFRSWDVFSGNVGYPVPSFSSKNPAQAYEIWAAELRLWDERTTYGAARLRLLDHMIDMLERLPSKEDAHWMLVELKRVKKVKSRPSYNHVTPYPDVKPQLVRTGATGICWEYGLPGAGLKLLMKLWPDYSGNEMFPVPSFTEGLDAEEEYQKAGSAYRLWDRRTLYGRARWRLLDWLIYTLFVYVNGEDQPLDMRVNY